jgi:hypothetical protein
MYSDHYKLVIPCFHIWNLNEELTTAPAGAGASYVTRKGGQESFNQWNTTLMGYLINDVLYFYIKYLPFFVYVRRYNSLHTYYSREHFQINVKACKIRFLFHLGSIVTSRIHFSKACPSTGVTRSCPKFTSLCLVTLGSPHL